MGKVDINKDEESSPILYQDRQKSRWWQSSKIKMVAGITVLIGLAVVGIVAGCLPSANKNDLSTSASVSEERNINRPSVRFNGAKKFEGHRLSYNGYKVSHAVYEVPTMSVSGPNDTCNLPNSQKMDCYPGGGSTKQNCEAKGCCWVPVTESVGDTPWCFYKGSSSGGYSLDSAKPTSFGYTAMLSRKDKTHWPNDVMILQMDIMLETENRLHFKIFDPNNKRYEPPVATPKVSTKSATQNYKISLFKKHAGIAVTRTSTGSSLFNSSYTLLTYADQFLSISTSLSTKYIYGLGEHRGPLLHDASKQQKFTFWARDQPPSENINLYGDHPLFLGQEEDGNVYGVFLLNSNAMEIDINPGSNGQPPLLIYNTIGGVLDFYVFVGPTANEVVQQYNEVIGRPFLPPYWALGYHLCRWGYGGTAGMKTVISRMRAAQIPYDTQWNDIDYMDNHLDWTYDTKNFAGLGDVVKDLHDHGQHYVMIVDPGIKNIHNYAPYDDGLKMGIFIMKADGSGPIIGTVWPGTTAFPDFTNPNTTVYWTKQATAYHQQVAFDGLWTDMNEPSNFVRGSTEGCPQDKNKWDNPPYTPGIAGGSLADKTLCASAKQYVSRHYDVHSLYGHGEAIASNAALTSIRGKRSLVITRSTFPSTGVYAGHWLGDNNADPQNMAYSIAGILNFNFFGIPLVGSDICGFMGTTNEDLCTRWTQLGAFYPFMRNHNTKGADDQDPANPKWKQSTRDAMKKAITLRYTLLPYLYTMLAESHVNGSAVARPLFFQYPKDVNTYNIDHQFMWGSGLLISPVLLNPSDTSVQAYIPKDTWYDYYTGAMVMGTGAMTTLQAPMDTINVHVRGGTIFPTQEPAVTTTLSRRNKFGLVVALVPSGLSSGQLYWDDGETIDSTEKGMYNLIQFAATAGSIRSIVSKQGYSTTMTLGSVRIMGVPSKPSTVTMNGAATQFQYDDTNKVLTLSGLSTNLLAPINVLWS